MRYLVVLVVASGMLAIAPRRIAAQAQVLCERVLSSPRGLEPFQLRVVAAPNGEYVALGQAGRDNGPPAPGGSAYYYAATHLYLARLTSGCDTVWQRFVPHLADIDIASTSGVAVDRYGIWALMSDTVYNYYTQRVRSRARLWHFTPTGRVRRSLVLPPRSYPENPAAALPAPGGGCYVSLTGPLGPTFPLTNYTVPSLARFDSTGTQVWRRNYAPVVNARLHVLAPSLRGTLLLAGTASRTPALDTYPKLIEVETSRGDSVNGAFVSPPPGPVTESMDALNEQPFDLLPLTRGRGYALTTEVTPNNGTTPTATGAVVRLDANYRVLWRYQYPNSQPGNDPVKFTQVRELADGSLLALARNRLPQRQCWLYRLDGTTGALLGAYAVPQGGQRQIAVNYLLPVAADSTLMLMGQVYSAVFEAAGLYVARVRIPNLPRIVTGTAGGSTPTTVLATDWQVYPNPAAGAATLWLPAPLVRRAASLALYNALGQRVREQTVPAATHETQMLLNLTGLPPGVYAVQLTTPDGTTVKRLAVE